MKKLYKIQLLLVILLCIFISSITLCASSTSDSEVVAIDYSILQEKDVYFVGYSADHSPFSFTDTDGNAAGMAIDIMNYIATITGINVSYVPLLDTSDQSSIDINLSILRMDQTANNSITSIPYFQFQMMLIGSDNQFDYNNAIIGHLAYSELYNSLIEEVFPGSTSKSYESYAELANDFEAGNVDFMLISSLVAQESKAIEEAEDTSILLTTITLDAMLKYNNTLDEEIINTFNSLLDSIDDDIIYNIILNSAINTANTDVTLFAYLRQHIIVIFIIVLYVVAFILIGVFIYMFNKRKALEKMLNFDELTGLMTEHNFIATTTKILKNANPSEKFYIVSYDIDNFKYINELYSYELGTQAIKLFAETISEAFGLYECMARPFADNLLILTKIPSKNGNICGKEVCTRCLDACLKGLLGPDYKLMTSAGIYEVTDKTLSVPYMIDCANTARGRGKGTYKRTELVFTKEIGDELDVKNEIISSMERGLLNKEFVMFYQPKMQFSSGTFIGSEALVRWFREDGKKFYPDEFINLFEENCFIARLDYYVFRAVSEFIVLHPETPIISVNISGKTFLEEDMIPNIKSIIQDTKVPVDKLEIEVTESAIVNEFEIITEKIYKLKEIGLTISMDDFGTGLSSLNRLNDLSIDVLKIDKGFLCDREINQKGESILEEIIAMAKKIGLKTIAEGVETIEQVTLLKNLSCDIAQGYFYSKPLSEEDYLTFIHKHTDA